MFSDQNVQIIPKILTVHDSREDGLMMAQLEFRLQDYEYPDHPVWLLINPGRHVYGNDVPLPGWLLGAVWRYIPGAGFGPHRYGWIRYGREAGYPEPVMFQPEVHAPTSFDEACRALLDKL